MMGVKKGPNWYSIANTAVTISPVISTSTLLPKNKEPLSFIQYLLGEVL
jgi:hypothetical protein